MGSARSKGEPALTIGDRLVTALMGFIAAFLTMCVVWLIALRLLPQAKDPPIPFSATWIVGLVAGAAGFAMGPERLMNAFGAVWAVFGGLIMIVTTPSRILFRRRD